MEGLADALLVFELEMIGDEGAETFTLEDGTYGSYAVGCLGVLEPAWVPLLFVLEDGTYGSYAGGLDDVVGLTEIDELGEGDGVPKAGGVYVVAGLTGVDELMDDDGVP